MQENINGNDNSSPSEQLVLMIPGPTWIRPDIRTAASFSEFGHRDSHATRILASIFENLGAIAELPDDYDIALINGSGTNGMESAIRSLVGDADRVLNVSVGIFGDLFNSIATSNGKDAERLAFPVGKGIDIPTLEAALARTRYDVVTLTHNESSTGVTTDVVQACERIRAHGALPVIDGVSIFGGAPSHIAAARPAAYVTATQKCLGLPAGLSIVFVHRDALEKARQVSNRGYATDLLKHVVFTHEQQTLTTPSCTLLNQMHAQLDYIVKQEGVHKRFARHTEMQRKVRNWVRASTTGLELFADDVDASPGVTAVTVPAELNLPELKAMMRAEGYLIDTGHKKLNEILVGQSRRPVIRIAHMADLTHEMLDRFLDKLGMAFEKSLGAVQ